MPGLQTTQNVSDHETIWSQFSEHISHRHLNGREREHKGDLSKYSQKILMSEQQ